MEHLNNLNLVLGAISANPSIDYSKSLLEWITYVHQILVPHMMTIQIIAKRKPYNIEQSNALLQTVNNKLKSQTFERMENDLAYTDSSKSAHGPNTALIIKGRPWLKSMYLILNFQEQVNNKLKENYLEDLENDITHIRKTRNILGGNSNFLHIKITVKRKNPLIFCFGEKCMSQARIIQPNEVLLRFRCCIFHTFCKNCAKDYLERKLGQSAFKGIQCLACEAMGDNTGRYITDDEIKNIIPAKEYNNFIYKDAADSLLYNCGSKFPSCPFKETRIPESKIVKFACGEFTCKECYAIVLEDYIYEVYNKFLSNPKELCKDIIKFSCPSRHPNTLGWIKLNQAKEYLKLSKSVEAKKNNIMTILEGNSILFSESQIKFCQKCNEIVPVECSDQIDCLKCNYCLNCSRPSHSNGTNAITCERLEYLLENNSPKRGKIFQKSLIDTNHPLYHNFTRAVQTLNLLSSKTLKIENITIAEESELQKFYNENLKLQYPSLKNLYLISEPYRKGEIRNKLYDPLPTDKTNGMIIFPCQVKSDNECEFFFYKILSLEGLVNRVPTGLDKTEAPQVYKGDSYYYISNSHAVTVQMILHCSRVS